jgi:hypothetical protein
MHQILRYYLFDSSFQFSLTLEQDNFYLNLMDWSNKDMLAVVLGKSIYVYDVEQGNVQKLLSFGELESSGLYPSSVRWIEDVRHLLAILSILLGADDYIA